MGIYKLFVLSCYNILHLLNILYCNKIAWIRHTGVAVLLFVQQCQLTFLIWHEEHLVIDNHICCRYAVNQRHKINRHSDVVHFNIGERPDNRRDVDAVHVHKAIHLASTIAHGNSLVINLEVGHRHNLVVEVHREIAVNIKTSFFTTQIGGINAAVLQKVFYLTDFYKEVPPFLAVKGQ